MNTKVDLFLNHIEATFAADDIDTLFSQLAPIAPPATMVQDIMSAVSRLPLPTVTDGNESYLPVPVLR